jgi:spore coat protein U-like protein
MILNANVTRSCNLGALPMMFGTVSIVNPQADAQAALIIDCTPNTTFTVTMDDGLNVRNGKRRMHNPAGNGNREYLEYEVYRNAGRTQRWGSTAATGITQTAPVNGKVTLIAYGRADGKRSVAGPYEDIITVTIAF